MDRCPICDWPMAEDEKSGCVPGNCSYRPREGTDEHRRIQARRRQLETSGPKEPGMPETLHLIAHKVRGEPAFDVAFQNERGWWILPSTGHRAYPYFTIELAEAVGGTNIMDFLSAMPADLPDFCGAPQRLTRLEAKVARKSELSALVGLGQPKAPPIPLRKL